MTYSTSSDASGKFAMKDIDPGKYRLTVMRTGFVTAEFGARGAMRSGTTLSLEPGKQMAEVNFRLTPHGVITGRVLDDDGEPVSMVQVEVTSYRYNQAASNSCALVVRAPMISGSTACSGFHRENSI
jgi:hypothetical protein